MGNASITTWLSLDRFAHIMGLNPLWFNQLYSSVFTGNCGEPWFQYAWQNHNRMGREDIAEAIQDAERQIGAYVGYNLIPDWVKAEQQRTTVGAVAGLYSRGHNAYGVQKSITTKRFHFISGGQRAKTLIENASGIIRSDEDNDGYDETCTVTVTTTVDACEIHLYFDELTSTVVEGAANDAWEIRPITVTKVGNTATIRFKIWQAVKPELWVGLAFGSSGIDADNIANFVNFVDVYRVYNDPSTQAELHWLEPNCGSCGGGGCASCEYGVQAGCLTAKDYRLGIVNYEPATWNTTTLTFDGSHYGVGRDPDRVKLWYYSGYRNENLVCAGSTMDNALERAVAYFACALSTREFCECNNTEAFLNYWREDLARSDSSRSYQNSSGVLDNPFGTTRGALYAWRICNEEGRRVQP